MSQILRIEMADEGLLTAEEILESVKELNK
jgi:hypothetical protein